MVGYRFDYKGNVPEPIKEIGLSSSLYGAEDKELHLIRSEKGFWLDVYNSISALNDAFYRAFEKLVKCHGIEILENLELLRVMPESGDVLEHAHDDHIKSWHNAQEELLDKYKIPCSK
ncbi:MAG: hypothetical protein HZB65_01120 [Candidatus Aenigmarchaeota archaeon]|nr:hypothetical protein [Candidatus Aenigmarchaeota archaeon]